MNRVSKILFLCLTVLMIGGCDISDDGQTFHLTTLRIISAEVPETFEHNGLYTIKVVYERPDGCTFFEGFDVTDVALTSRDIVAIGSVLTDTDTACTLAIEQVEADFEFRVLYTEPYVFRFYSGNDEDGNPIYLEYTIEVASEPSGK